MSSSIGYYRMYNKQRRKNDQRNNKSGLPSWWREAGRGKENCHQISTGAHLGDAAGTPSLPNIGSQVHRDRIFRSFKSSFQRSSSRVCLELITPAREQRANQPPTLTEAHEPASAQAHKLAREQASANSVPVIKRTSKRAIKREPRIVNRGTWKKYYGARSVLLY